MIGEQPSLAVELWILLIVGMFASATVWRMAEEHAIKKPRRRQMRAERIHDHQQGRVSDGD